MPIFPRRNADTSRPRPRRALRFSNADIDALEVRTLLSSAAVIGWSMVPQIADDPAHGNQPDLPNTAAYVNPPDGYGVRLDASQSIGIQPTSTFAWTVTDSQGHSTPLTGEDPTISLPQGSYTVQLSASGLIGTIAPLDATTIVEVKDVLIVSIGDSYASGEGDPVVPSPIDPQWAYSPDPAMNAENADAHRSTVAGPAQFALQLQQANPHEAVTFVSVADSGATVPAGVLGPMASIGDPSRQLPAQMTELRQIIGTRHIDVLTVSVGADDIGFSTLARDLISNTYTGSPSRPRILAYFRTRLRELPQHYAALAQAIQSFDPGQVLVTDYPDLTRNRRGRVAPFIGPAGLPLVSRRDALLTSQKIIPALDAAIASASRTYGWTPVPGITTDFLTHGYPSTTSWIRTLGESLLMQGDDDGTFHPNAAGHQDIARRLMGAYLGTTEQGNGQSRPASLVLRSKKS